jgi:hypothetical protein
MSILDRFPSKYLKASDIAPGEVVTVREVRDELVGPEQDAKPVIYFHEHPKGVVMNVTNAKSIAKDLGEDETEWAGKKLVLSLIETRSPRSGEPVDAIRMKAAPLKKKAAAEVTAASEGKVPF